MLPGAEPCPADAHGARPTAGSSSSFLHSGMRAGQEHGAPSTLGHAPQWPGQVSEGRRRPTEPAQMSVSPHCGGMGTTPGRSLLVGDLHTERLFVFVFVVIDVNQDLLLPGALTRCKPQADGVGLSSPDLEGTKHPIPAYPSHRSLLWQVLRVQTRADRGG